MTTVTLTMPGRCWSQAISGSNVPDEENWPAPTVRHVGTGTSHVYDVDRPTALSILAHVLDLYESWFGYDKAAKDRADLRPFLRRYNVLDSDGYPLPEDRWTA